MRQVSLLLAVTLSATLLFAGSAIWCSKVAAQQDPSDPHDSWTCTENCEEGPSILLVITADFPLILLHTIVVTISDLEYSIIDRLSFNPGNSNEEALYIKISPGPHLNDRVVFRGRGKRILLDGNDKDIADGVVLARFPSCPQGKECFNEYHLHLYPRGDDFDGDGFTPALLQPTFRDCDDTTPEVRPFRSEIVGDGIDNNCNGEIR